MNQNSEHELETLRRERGEARKELCRCRDELCLKCGKYRERHKGNCDGCRWKDMSKWEN